ncbi:MAG: TAXI family TRAP transporter solute-binding subunit [Alphaproteobacteria bacterium]|nr:TAXI family TRAP transporter solute-binding subunit [Alphaproteobacteria bacterium]
MFKRVERQALQALTAVTLLCSSLAHAQDLNIIRLGTGSTAGTYFPIGGLIGTVISNPPGSRPCERGGSCGVPGLIAVAQSTGGSLDNIKSVESGAMELALSQADVAYWSYYGTGSFEGDKPRDSLRALANLFPENIHLIARADAGIETLSDLRGKRVSIGGAGSGTQIDARLILTAFGLRFSEMNLITMDLEPSTSALVAGEIDAFFVVTGAPALGVQDLAERMDITFVPIDGPIAHQLAKIFPFFSIGVIPQGVYGDNPVTPTLDVGALLIGRADMPNALAYGVARAIWHPNTAPLLANGHPRAKLMSLAGAAKGIGFKIHPGARQYYVEQGILPAPATEQAGTVDPPKSIR